MLYAPELQRSSMSEATSVQVRYAECVTYQLPGVLTPASFSDGRLRDYDVNLATLATDWRRRLGGDGARYWIEDERVLRPPTYGTWVGSFDSAASARVSLVHDPANNEAPESIDEVEISFNEEALAQFALLLDDSSANSRQWSLQSLTVSVPQQSPVGHVVALFEVSDQISGPDLDRLRGRVLHGILSLWTVLYALLESLDSMVLPRTVHASRLLFWRKTVRVPQRAWSDTYYPFGVPPTLRRAAQSAWDVSEDYQHEGFLFISGDPSLASIWATRLGVTVVNASDSDVVSMSWATTLWYTAANLSGDETVARVRRLTLTGRILKYATFMTELSTALLEQAHANENAADPRELRNVALHYHVLFQSVWTRRLLLTEFDYKCVESGLAICKAEERYLPTATRMCDLLIKAAEGLEREREERRASRLNQVVAVITALGIISVITGLVDVMQLPRADIEQLSWEPGRSMMAAAAGLIAGVVGAWMWMLNRR
jgi:hypothetical protein